MFNNKIILCSLLTTMLITVENTCKTDAEIVHELIKRYENSLDMPSCSTEDKDMMLKTLQTLLADVQKTKPGFVYKITPTLLSICITIFLKKCCMQYEESLSNKNYFDFNNQDLYKVFITLCTPAIFQSKYSLLSYGTDIISGLIILLGFNATLNTVTNGYDLVQLEKEIQKDLDELNQEKSDEPCKD